MHFTRYELVCINENANCNFNLYLILILELCSIKSDVPRATRPFKYVITFSSNNKYIVPRHKS